MKAIKKHLRALVAGLLYIICNYFVNIIPSWSIRKLLYKMCGMKIGKHSRIMMKTIVTLPWKVKIGNNTVVNEYCYLDGRGGLTLGNNVNVALFSMLITGSHNYKSSRFEYYTESIVVEDNAWLAARCTVLNGCTIKEGAIISAGAVVMPHTQCESWSIYSGVPARKIKDIDFVEREVIPWTVYFR